RRRHAIEHGLTELGVSDLAATEHHGHLDLVLLLEKPACVPGLRVEVVIVDPRTELHLLELDHVLLLLCLPRLLRHLELVLAVAHDGNRGGTGGWGDFGQVEALLLRHAQRHVDFEDAELSSVSTDDSYRADANHAVDPHALCGVLNTDI